MTKSKKQRTKEANSAHDRQKLFVLAAAAATVLVVILIMAG